MDNLIDALVTFSFSEVKTSEYLDMLMQEAAVKDNETEELDDPDIEWDIISKNFCNLRYIDELLDIYDFPETDKLKNILKNILDKVDKQTQKYLDCISWDIEIKQGCLECTKIKELFEKSLNVNDIFEKLHIIVEAYCMFIPIIEDCRKEKCIAYVDDEELIDDMERLKKKRKIN